ncbi:MAG TPA: MraY family glycosyltransferase [Verrucomicrobiae bacterium]|jgi:UDP-GlcNAc:undecaprenyl-phosphate GlcNAc-1-phosphate transferase
MTGLVGLATALLVVPVVLAVCRRAEKPRREQDLHHGQAAAVPRYGGLALAVAFIAVNAFLAFVHPTEGSSLILQPSILVCCLAMFLIGFLDDLKPLGARKKFLAQVVVATAVCFCGVGIQTFKVPFTGSIIQLGPWGALLTIVWLVGITNLINLIDGVDGLAGGIALMLMALLGYVGHETGNLQLLIAGMGGALLGFLCFNFPPARIYLGDGGAYFLGFQIALFAIEGSHKGEIMAALAAPLFVLVLPILDASLAILRRGLRGLPLFRPDRRHLHHHLLDTGLSHRKIVLIFYGATSLFLAMGMAAYWSRGNLVPVLLGLTVLVVLLGAGQFQFSRRWFAVGRMLDNSLKMRREIEYAVCLSRWLALEGSRGQGVEELWNLLAVIAERLGYTSMKLILADGERSWSRFTGPKSHESDTTRLYRHKLLGGRCGVLELSSPCFDENGIEGDSAVPSSRQRNWARPTITDQGLSETITELVAEGWIKATSNYINANGENRTLHFSDGKSFCRTNSAGSRVSMSPFPLAETRDFGDATQMPERNPILVRKTAPNEQLGTGTPAFLEVGI